MRLASTCLVAVLTAGCDGVAPDSVSLISNFGERWFENNVQAEFANRVRQAVRKHGMNETAIQTNAVDAIDSEVSKAMTDYIAQAKLPIRLIDVTVGRANPPDSIKTSASRRPRRNSAPTPSGSASWPKTSGRKRSRRARPRTTPTATRSACRRSSSFSSRPSTPSARSVSRAAVPSSWAAAPRW